MNQSLSLALILTVVSSTDEIRDLPFSESGTRIHFTEPGDTLELLAERYCGDWLFAYNLAAYNRLDYDYDEELPLRMKIYVDGQACDYEPIY